jgi:hypothetical protein
MKILEKLSEDLEKITKTEEEAKKEAEKKTVK